MLGRISPTGVYGLIQQRRAQWYLWPGFCFFSRDAVAGTTVDFMPSHVGDTGSKMWRTLYKSRDQAQSGCLQSHYTNLRAGSDPQSDMAEYFDGWIHTFNGSRWKETPSKDALVEQMLLHY
jgi:hypothetical protein